MIVVIVSWKSEHTNVFSRSLHILEKVFVLGVFCTLHSDEEAISK